MLNYLGVVVAIFVVAATFFYFRKTSRPRKCDDGADGPTLDGVDASLQTTFNGAADHFASVVDEADTKATGAHCTCASLFNTHGCYPAWQLALKLYGLYKFVKKGSCTPESEPSRLNMEGHAKWTVG